MQCQLVEEVGAEEVHLGDVERDLLACGVARDLRLGALVQRVVDVGDHGVVAVPLAADVLIVLVDLPAEEEAAPVAAVGGLHVEVGLVFVVDRVGRRSEVMSL